MFESSVFPSLATRPAGRLLVLLSLVTSLVATGAPWASPGSSGDSLPRPRLAVRLHPGRTAEVVDHVDVTMTLTGVTAVADTPFLQVPIIIAGMPAAVYRDGEVVALDAGGPLELAMTEDRSDATGFQQFRRFAARRNSAGSIEVRYTAAVPPPGSPRRSGPPFDLRSEAGGFSGAGYGFLILPIDEREYDLDLDWDLADMAAGARGVSSLGPGHVRTTGKPERLDGSYVMAGPLGRYPEDAGTKPFNAWWLGSPPFDVARLMAWTERAHAALQTFFRDSNAPPFMMFARAGSIRAAGGAALENSFMIGLGTEPQSESSMHFLLAHEMAHHWIGVLEGRPGATSWYSEGLAEYYKLMLPLRGGLIDPDAFVEELDRSTSRYYTNPRQTIPNDSVAAGFWSDSNVRLVPYQRGLMYFADLDAKLRVASAGQRSLDDVLLAFLDSGRHGVALTAESWTAAVTAELGPRAKTDLDAMFGGAVIVPPPGAFGPCFTRRARRMRRFELGFAEPSFRADPPRVQGLVPGSAAAQAGLREGDRILEHDEIAPSQTDPACRFSLEIERDGRPRRVTFLPRADWVTGYEWVRVTPAGAGDCGR